MKTNNIRHIYPISGMRCAACAGNVERAVRKIPGVRNANVVLSENCLYVSFSHEDISPVLLREAVQAIGFDLMIEDSEEERFQRKEIQEQQTLRIMKRNVLLSWSITIMMIIGMLTPISSPFVFFGLMLVLATPVYVFFGRSYHINAIKQIRHGITSMDTLISLSTTVSFLYSVVVLFSCLLQGEEPPHHLYFDATVMVITFVLTGKYLEKRATHKTGNAIKQLMDLMPKEALLLQEEKTKPVPIGSLKIGDKIVVRPGEQIPVDGIVVAGSSSVDEKVINGEPLPIDKTVGDKLFAGTMNEQGVLTMETTHVGMDTLLGLVIQHIREAQTHKVPIQRMADRMASIFVPTVIGLSILTYILWITIGGAEYQHIGLLCAISVMVVACPCALGLATPTALVVSIGKAAKNHILIHDAEVMEQIPHIDTVVLDKTGTITEGRPSVSSVTWNIPDNKTSHYETLLWAAEKLNTHPLAIAICEYFENTHTHHSTFPQVLNYENVPGCGIAFTHANHRYRVGNAYFAYAENAIWKNAVPSTAALVYMSEDEKPIVRITIIDRLLPSSKEAIKEVMQSGINVIMLTGDRYESAAAIATFVGIDCFESDMRPENKYHYVEKLRQTHKVMVVGDGINDSSALSAADVSIAIGKGSDIAKKTASITFAKHDLRLLTTVYRLSKSTKRVIYQNLFWALVYNVLSIPIAAGILYPSFGILLNPAIAGAAMACSSICVVGNSLRLNRLHI